MWHTWYTGGIHSVFVVRLKTDNLEGQHTDGSMILQWIFKKWVSGID